jgi:hypothetical protein
MPLPRDSGFQFAIVKEILDPNAHKRQIEEKIKAVEEWNKLLDEKAARQEIEAYKQSKPHPVRTCKNDCISQFSLKLDELVSSTVDQRS